MKILVPLNNIDYVTEYIEAGADEFYIGFYDKDWENKFGEFHDINRMSGFKEMANSFSFDEILSIVQRFKKLKKELYITFNSSIYSQDQINKIEEYFIRLKEVDVDGVIVSTIELVQLAKKHNIFSVVSTIAGIYNSDLIQYYQREGANRIIFPRDVTSDEIISMSKNVPTLEYEVFLMRNGCVFSDSHCLGLHRKEICSVCAGLKKSGKQLIGKRYSLLEENIIRTTLEQQRGETIDEGSVGSIKDKSLIEFNNKLFHEEFHSSACGLCSIYKFIAATITTCKIVGRYDEWKEICSDIKLVKENIEIAKTSKGENEYLEAMIKPKNSESVCKKGMSCYYPEIRFKK